MTVLDFLTRHPVAFWAMISLVGLAGAGGYVFSRIAGSDSAFKRTAPMERGIAGKLEHAFRIAEDANKKKKNTQELLLSLKEAEEKAMRIAAPPVIDPEKSTPTETVEPLPSLEGIMVANAVEGGLKRYAILNGKRLEKGMTLGSYRLVEIKDFSVLLEGPKGLKEISVTRYPLPKGIVDESQKVLEESKPKGDPS